MFKFSKSSEEKLNELHNDLKTILLEAIKVIDFTILCGYRGKEDQEKAFNEGKSNAHFGKSKHNLKPSKAVDVAPYPIDWKNIDRFEELAITIKNIAKKQGISIVWGGDWKTIKDYPHFELK